MKKTILLTGATDGIGFEAAKLLAQEGHTLLLHGRSQDKLEATQAKLSEHTNADSLKIYRADLSDLGQTKAMADQIRTDFEGLDVVLNNAGVFNVPNPGLDNGQDIRFVVNTLAPYVLAKNLLPILRTGGRVVNISSAAQAPVNLEALEGRAPLDAGAAYAQSKLAIMMWTNAMAAENSGSDRVFVSVNPASFLGSKMVKEAYGMAGKDLSIGADILYRAAVSDEFVSASGKYYDNDSGAFGTPHPDALDVAKISALMRVINRLTNGLV